VRSRLATLLMDKSGAIREMWLKKALPAPTISYAVMESVHQWKFEPGTLDGQPVDVLSNLTVNFKLR
jgi:outer membrane biosynthesis protein TonB